MGILLRAVLLLLLSVSVAGAGTISRSSGGSKSDGTNWATGDTVTAADLNGDFNTAYTAINGNLNTDNIATGGVGSTQILDDDIVNADVNSAAAILPSKIDGYGDDDTNQVVVEDPGTTGALSNATNMENEIAQLRYAIKRLGMGVSLTNSIATWVDQPMIGPNLVYHGSFEATDGDGDLSAAVVPDGWGLDSTTPAITYVATGTTEGAGAAVVVTADANDEQIVQQLTLKEATDFLVIARVKADGTNNCTLGTSGAATDMTDQSSNTASYVTLSGLFTTVGSALDVVDIDLVTAVNTGVCTWDHVGVYELGADPIPTPGNFVVRTTGTQEDTGCQVQWTDAGDCDDIMSIVVETPAPGYLVHLHARVHFVEAAILGKCSVRIYDGTNTITMDNFVFDSSGASAQDSVTLNYTVINQVPNTAVTYQVDAVGAGCSTSLADVDGVTHVHYLEAMVIAP